MIVKNVLLLLSSSSREVASSALSFIKVTLFHNIINWGTFNHEGLPLLDNTFLLKMLPLLRNNAEIYNPS
jgi:hypothetical protein